jgi:predicted HD phosphohydrolase
MNEQKIDWRVLQVISLYELFGKADYLGEPVSQEEHALQAGTYALKQQYSEPLVVAALFHDVGHLLGYLVDLPVMIEDTKTNTNVGVAHHETLGARYLKKLGFPDSVTVPVEQHVAVKRYLRHQHPDYVLSTGSEQSLRAQGGPMSDKEAQQFEADVPSIDDCVALRLCEDHAKDPQAVPFDWEFFRPIITRVLKKERKNVMG